MSRQDRPVGTIRQDPVPSAHLHRWPPVAADVEERIALFGVRYASRLRKLAPMRDLLGNRSLESLHLAGARSPEMKPSWMRMVQRGGLEQVHGLKGLCASSWEYNYSPFRCLLGSGCKPVDYGRTKFVSVGRGKQQRNVEEHTFRFFSRHLSHLGIPRCAGVGSGVYLHSRPAAQEQ